MHYAELCGFANRFTRDPDQSEDLVQEVFFKVWETAKSLELKQGLKPYLYQSVRNASLNFIKHEGVKAAHARLHLFKLDLAVGIRRSRARWSSELKIDIQNVLNSQADTDEWFNEETQSIEYGYHFPILPVLSYKVSW